MLAGSLCEGGRGELAANCLPLARAGRLPGPAGETEVGCSPLWAANMVGGWRRHLERMVLITKLSVTKRSTKNSPLPAFFFKPEDARGTHISPKPVTQKASLHSHTTRPAPRRPRRLGAKGRYTTDTVSARPTEEQQGGRQGAGHAYTARRSCHCCVTALARGGRPALSRSSRRKTQNGSSGSPGECCLGTRTLRFG